MKILFKIISKKQWNILKNASPYASPFQDYEWGSLTTKILGGNFYAVMARSNGLKWIIPLYEGKPWVRKKGCYRIGGVGYGGPLPTHVVTDVNQELEYLYKIIDQLRVFVNADGIEWTLYPSKFWDDTNISKTKTCRIQLGRGKDYIFNKVLSGNVRTAIRKSDKSGIIIREINVLNHDELKAAHYLLTKTQERVGSEYLTDYDLFLALSSLRSDLLQAKTFVAVFDKQIIGVATLIFDNNEAFHLFHGWDYNFKKVCSNQALIWGLICYSVDLNIQIFNMGESHTESLLKAKLRWGAKIESVPKS